MIFRLTEADLFSDRVEMVGYATLAAAAVYVFVYFGMIFFYAPVRYAGLGTQAGTLLLYSALTLVSGFVVAQRNWARWICLAGFLGLGCAWALRLADGRAWWLALPLGWACFGFWVLTYPAGVARFRPLRGHEQRMGEGASWYWGGLVLLLFFAVYQLAAGFKEIFATSAETSNAGLTGMGRLVYFVVLIGILAGLQRLQAWARWTGAVVCLFAGVGAMPGTFSAQGYVSYWLSLAKFGFFLWFGVYLAFSGFARARFRRPAATPAAGNLQGNRRFP